MFKCFFHSLKLIPRKIHTSTIDIPFLILTLFLFNNYDIRIRTTSNFHGIIPPHHSDKDLFSCISKHVPVSWLQKLQCPYLSESVRRVQFNPTFIIIEQTIPPAFPLLFIFYNFRLCLYSCTKKLFQLIFWSGTAKSFLKDVQNNILSLPN